MNEMNEKKYNAGAATIKFGVQFNEAHSMVDIDEIMDEAQNVLYYYLTGKYGEVFSALVDRQYLGEN